ncbi:MAG: PAS domain-containing sensor histidine kinase [Peptococcales bacterium]
MNPKNEQDYYLKIKWLTFVIPVLGVAMYEFLRFEVFNEFLSPITNSLILTLFVGIFGFIFSTWLFRKIQTIHNTLFWEQHRLKIIFQHTSDGIIVLDENCKVIALNPAAERLTGWNKKEVINKFTCDLMNGCSKSKEICWNSPSPDCMSVDCGHRECWGRTCLNKQVSFPYIEMCILRKDGRKIKIAASYSYIPAFGIQKPQVKLVIRDISERKEFEKTIQNYATLEERYRLAREMHDGLAQALVYLNIKVHNIQKKIEKQNSNPMLKNDLAEIRQITREAVSEVRQNIFALKTPPMEETSCFRLWIEDYLKHFGSINHIETEFTCDSLDAYILSTEIKVQLIRIIQEALSNIRKHARATKATIFLTRNKKEIIIRIFDNGKGINYKDLEKGRDHFGLTIMQERAQIIGADLKIVPHEPRGTLVELAIPVDNTCQKFA